MSTKGPVDWVVKWVVDRSDEIGYRGVAITLKRDQEPAMLAMQKAIAAKRTGVTTPIDPPARESQCNGAVAQAVRPWQGQLRTLKGHYEDNVGV